MWHVHGLGISYLALDVTQKRQIRGTNQVRGTCVSYSFVALGQEGLSKKPTFSLLQVPVQSKSRHCSCGVGVAQDTGTGTQKLAKCHSNHRDKKGTSSILWDTGILDHPWRYACSCSKTHKWIHKIYTHMYIVYMKIHYYIFIFTYIHVYISEECVVWNCRKFSLFHAIPNLNGRFVDHWYN